MALSGLSSKKTLETTILDTAPSTIRSPERQPDSVPGELVEEEELELLEAEAKEMAQKILEYRAILPDQLKFTLTSSFAAQRPTIDNVPSRDSKSDIGRLVESSKSSFLTSSLLEEDKKAAKKVHLLEVKISNNLSAMPIVLKKMKECVSKIDSLDFGSGVIHPAFQKSSS